MLNILILENDAHTSEVLSLGINKGLEANVRILPNLDNLRQLVKDRQWDVAIVNHNLDDYESFADCTLIKNLDKDIRIIVLAAPGKPFTQVTLWQKKTRSVDAIIEKPIDFGTLNEVIQQLYDDAQTRARALSTFEALKKHLPYNMTSEQLGSARSGDLLITERTILFTDIRNSTEFISQESLETYVKKINSYFTKLGSIVERYEGEVIKFTGDGLLAVFGGFARCQLAVKCAQVLATPADFFDDAFKIGIGISDGIIMLGFIGPQSRMFYDVIGANVNIAARLCAQAAEGEIIMTSHVRNSSRMDLQGLVETSVQAKGFKDPVSCFKYNPGDSWRG